MTEAAGAVRRILAVDIGGTHCRFAHFKLEADGGLRLMAVSRIRTAGVESQDALLEALHGATVGLPPERADGFVFAVPGAVVDRRVRFANIGWDLDLDALDAALGAGRVCCLNDFTAQALGCRTEATAETLELRSGELRPDLVQAVIGAGTGCGMAALVPLPDGGFLPLASEGGQTEAKFGDPVERAFAQYLGRLTGEPYVRVDTVLSGSGLTRLHCFLTGESLTPPEVSARLTEASQTAALFARFYGRVVRDYALTVVAAGGVFLSGGVAGKNPLLVRHPEFTREFLKSTTYGGLLARIPVRLIAHDHTGLYGAARYAATHLPPLA